MVFCQSPDLEIDSGLIALFDSSAPSGWTRFSSLDSRMPRGASSYGGTGGSTTHTHTTTGGYNTSTVTGTTRKSGATASAGDHYHTTVAGTTDPANNLPPYLDMVFASIDSDGVGIASSIVIVSAVPPLGWSRFSSLDSTLPRGASSYGGSGGSNTHTHSVTIETGAPSSTSTAGGGLVDTATSTHTHSCTDTTDEQSNIPPYLDVIYAKRDNPVASTTVGDEESNGGGGGFQGSDTYSYIYSGDGERVIEVVSTTNVITTVFIGNYYEYTITGTEAITKSYYYAGATRVAMRDEGTLYFLLSDHLGSTSLTVDGNGDLYAEMRYKPWGSVRYIYETMPTDFTYTGQRSEVSSFGLMFYGARWFDSDLGRFSQPDSIIPGAVQGVQAWERYAYSNNNPINRIDPTGHWSINISFNVSAIVNTMVNTMTNLFGVSSTDVAKGLDTVATGLDTAALVVDSTIATGDVVSGIIGGTLGAGISVPEGGAPVVVTGPAGVGVGMGLFEASPAVRLGLAAGNGLATISTGLTALSDVITGETNDISSFSLSESGIQYTHETIIGRDTLTSGALSAAGWISPIGLTSAPLQAAAVLNDLEMLYAGPLSIIPKSIPICNQEISIDWE
jgi:RHS repeat-associated protein